MAKRRRFRFRQHLSKFLLFLNNYNRYNFLPKSTNVLMQLGLKMLKFYKGYFKLTENLEETISKSCSVVRVQKT